MRAWWLGLVMAAVCVLFALTSHADAVTDFEKARSSYEGGRYDEAAERFQAMLDPKSPTAVIEPWLIEKTRTYYAACLIALGRGAEADAQITAILRTNPSASADPMVFPSAVLDRFSDVRAKIREELETREAERLRREQQERARALAEKNREERRIAMLESLARQEVHIVRNSRWIAAIPGGAGQFQNGQTALGWLFLSTETALAATTMVTGVMVSSLESQGFVAGIDRNEINSRNDTATTINRVSFGALLTVVVVGILHAELTFVPEQRTVRQRPLRQEPVLAPVISAVPTGGLLGVRATF